MIEDIQPCPHCGSYATQPLDELEWFCEACEVKFDPENPTQQTEKVA